MTAGDSWMNRPAARISRASRQHRSSLTMNDTKQLIILATPRCVMNIERNIIYSGISLIALIAWSPSVRAQIGRQRSTVMTMAHSDAGPSRKIAEFIDRAMEANLRGDRRTALANYEQVLALSHQSRDRTNEDTMLLNISVTLSKTDQRRQALSYLRQALDLSRSLRYRAVEAHALDTIGSLYREAGDLVRALEHSRQALAIQQQEGDTEGENVTLNNIALLLNESGDKVPHSQCVAALCIG
jgi:tetratricopeptide (TPR) repeat protein